MLLSLICPWKTEIMSLNLFFCRMITLIFATFFFFFFFNPKFFAVSGTLDILISLRSTPTQKWAGVLWDAANTAAWSYCASAQWVISGILRPRLGFLFSGCSDTLYTSLHTSPVYTAVCLSPPQTVKGDDCLWKKVAENGRGGVAVWLGWFPIVSVLFVHSPFR